MWIFFTIAMLYLTFLRVMYTKGLVDDWNNSLMIYIEYCFDNPESYKELTLQELLKYELKTVNWWYRLDCWTINDIIEDKDIIRKITWNRSNYLEEYRDK